MTLALLFALISVLANLTYLVLFFTLHFLPTGYNLVRHAVSDYAVGKYGKLFRVALWASAIGVLALAAGLAQGVGAPPLASRDLILLALAAVARIVMTFFPTDLEGQRLTPSGIVHYLCAIAAFAFAYMVVSNMTPTLQVLNPWNQIQQPLGALAWLVLPALILVIVTLIRPLRRVFGLFERIFLLDTNIWMFLVSLLLLFKTF